MLDVGIKKGCGSEVCKSFPEVAAPGERTREPWAMGQNQEVLILVMPLSPACCVHLGHPSVSQCSYCLNKGLTEIVDLFMSALVLTLLNFDFSYDRR